MTAPTAYPGVHVEEKDSDNIAVNASSTMVPILCMGSTWGNKTWYYKNWMEVVKSYGSGSPDLNFMHVASLRAYFEAGGGPCYAVQLSNVHTAVNDPSISANHVVACGQGIAGVSAEVNKFERRIFTIFDMPATEITNADAAKDLPASPDAAAYYPRLKVKWTNTDIPASAVVAALYCENDRTRGVWKAPANIAVPAGFTPKYKVTDDIEGTYTTGKAINMIRSLGDAVPRIWGARTLDDSDDWRYVSVRRLFNSVEDDMRHMMEALMFEPNMPLTWEKARSAAISHLHGLWKKGALAGASDEEAYFAQIGKNVTMSDADIAQGKMILKIGLAAVRPAEFIILEFSQSMPGG
ncbi:phage tail sheath C-terminal domain-containing protein [Caballeronia sp. LZ035]|uniref:phage tail sheath family protein n=1 Tax=Caballeronia sp. LZ035 TaxID=3038568 RepID=UPI00285DE8E1|nr:phage tail sheath C-terminal domain-containing protein [Caballeronia sp. LZ035]MDR5760126.1 phage tail sheath C-terminal domain-containing protein [Caballeronia sp. LZ035]